jgi:hypothetical protein
VVALSIEGVPVDTGYAIISYIIPGSVTAVRHESSSSLPKTVQLEVYPNPFNDQTVIRYEIPNNENYTLQIYDIRGRRVRTLVPEPGEVSVHWNGRADGDHPVSSGTYMIQLKGRDFRLTRKMVLLR